MEIFKPREISRPSKVRTVGRTAEPPLANNILWLFVSSQSLEDGLTKLVVAGPLGKLDLGDQHGFDPVALFHHCRGDALTPASRCFLWQVYEGARLPLDLLYTLAQMLQGLLREAGADPAGEQEAVRALAADSKAPKYWRLRSGGV